MSETQEQWTHCGRQYDGFDHYCGTCGKSRPAPAPVMTSDERLSPAAEAKGRRAAFEAVAGWDAQKMASSDLAGEIGMTAADTECPQHAAIRILREQNAEIERLTRELAEARNAG